MTEEQLAALKMSARIGALEALLSLLLGSLLRTEISRKSFREWGNQLVEKSDQMTFPTYTAEYSDLQAAEFQEAIRDLLEFVYRELEKQPPQ